MRWLFAPAISASVAEFRTPMRFPSRLTLELTRARFAGLLRARRTGWPIVRIDPGEILHSRSTQPVSHRKIDEIVCASRPIVWIGGSESLAHPGIAHLVRSIAARGRFVFLETDGLLLRRRIHEFQAVPNVVLAICMDSCPASSAVLRIPPDPSQLAVEGIRAACLSGFFTAIHSRVCVTSTDSQWTRLAAFAADSAVDGWVVTAETRETVPQARELRRLIPNSRWRVFSESLERELLSGAESESPHLNRILPDSSPVAREESVSAS